MEFDLTPQPTSISIQGSKNVLNPIEEYCQKHKLTYALNELFEAYEIILYIDSNKSEKHWHHIRDQFNPHYLNLEYNPPYLDQRWISRTRHRHLWAEKASKKEPISIHKLIKEHFDEHLNTIKLDSSFYQSKLYYSMLFYILMEFMSERHKMVLKELTPVGGAYFELIKNWTSKELAKYQNYHLNTLQDLKIID
jgi:hypothetical protein